MCLKLISVTCSLQRAGAAGWQTDCHAALGPRGSQCALRGPAGCAETDGTQLVSMRTAIILSYTPYRSLRCRSIRTLTYLHQNQSKISSSHCPIKFKCIIIISIQIYRNSILYFLSFLTLKGNTLASSWRRRTRTRNKALHPLLARPKRPTHTPNTHTHIRTHLTSHSYHVQPRVASCHRNLTNNKSRRGRMRRIDLLHPAPPTGLLLHHR